MPGHDSSIARSSYDFLQLMMHELHWTIIDPDASCIFRIYHTHMLSSSRPPHQG
jgi:hypothetical protein